MSRFDEPTGPVAVADARRRILRAHDRGWRCCIECPRTTSCRQYVWATTPQSRPAA